MLLLRRLHLYDILNDGTTTDDHQICLVPQSSRQSASLSLPAFAERMILSRTARCSMPPEKKAIPPRIGSSNPSKARLHVEAEQGLATLFRVMFFDICDLETNKYLIFFISMFNSSSKNFLFPQKGVCFGNGSVWRLLPTQNRA